MKNQMSLRCDLYNKNVENFVAKGEKNPSYQIFIIF